MHLIYATPLTKVDTFYSRVSPRAARAREQPMVTVFSIEAGSRRDGFTSYIVSTALNMKRIYHTMMSSATRQPVSATASVM
jgi:hypothetical protein